MSNQDLVEELERLKRLVGDPAAGGEHWYGVPRDEAIKQAISFHQEMQRWSDLFYRMRDERDALAEKVQAMNAERMAWGLALAEVVADINRK